MAADETAPDESAAAKGGRAKGELEAEVLGALQHAAPQALSPREVKDVLGGGLSYSTVVTALSRLYAKGLLRRSPRGRAFAYAPVADESGLAAREMRQVLDRRPDREAVLTRFVDDLSSDDEELLRRLLDSGQ
ncbi:BlaI/MecI/CopY family transcriptional regulator [Streptomyces sp. G-G2]|uniref:BlaI/MecI/CopY family transcriptional regulator n=1 Tax=Streptomyces sp. G-G2 TaxID=3046201 RepID=UPI0024B99B8B|nr:BlaI/MecI/CopY family transcriptional regulator [Streptomyces sp. G-G2]MDJ0382511.1 BlaI/MecI/CopY family transcriptional regulator [Streptomyces sp. G-G2]